MQNVARDMKTLGSLFIFLTCITPMVIAQNKGAIQGIVVDSETEGSLPGVHVYLASSSIGDISNPDGYFRIDQIPAGSYQLIATMIGYQPIQQTIDVTRAMRSR